MSFLKKSFLLIIISLCCFGITANAQLPQFGVKAGLNLANVIAKGGGESPFPGKELKLGFVAGAFMTYEILPLISVQPEVLFSMKGTKGSAETNVPYDYTQTYNYIEIPIFLKLNLPLGPVVPFNANFFAGPDFAFNVASNEKITAQGGPGGSLTLDTKDVTQNFDFNLVAGAGLGFDVGPTTLGLELRYTFGTGSLAKPNEGDLRNSVFAVMASIGI